MSRRRRRLIKLVGDQLDTVRSGVNFMFHKTSCSVHEIARNYDISWSAANNLILPRWEWEAWEKGRKTGRAVPDR